MDPNWQPSTRGNVEPVAALGSSTLTEMSMDYYPARKAARSRKEFNPYTEAMMARDKWIESILQVGHS